jgi:hypothetical protein
MRTKFLKNAIPLADDVVIVPYGTTASQQEIAFFQESLFRQLQLDWASFLTKEDLHTLVTFASNFVFFNESTTPLFIVGEAVFRQLYFKHVGDDPGSLFETLKTLFPSLPLMSSDYEVDGCNCIYFVEPIIDANIFDEEEECIF